MLKNYSMFLLFPSVLFAHSGNNLVHFHLEAAFIMIPMIVLLVRTLWRKIK
jgi:hypothetical protein|tara:strand:- start:1501 stop:1653 length:153 start_codon:yes stop_codon:yes gene_type:complete